MKKMIRVYDDVEALNEQYTSKLQNARILRHEDFDVKSLDSNTFTTEMKKMKQRQSNSRDGKGWGNVSSDFDKMDIFIIDYDLQELEPLFSGETACYFVRCFSRCGMIIGLNQYGQKPFDLTLRGHLESWADLNIGCDQLDNRRLWGGRADEFCPWYWPQILGYLDSYQNRLREVTDNPDAVIYDFLEVEDAFNLLPRSVGSFISGRTKLIDSKVTFRKFVEESGNGLKPRDKNPTTEMIGRIAAARVSKWLERWVLPGQDMLVDAPHLVSRYPSLLEGNRNSMKSWNATAILDSTEYSGIKHKEIERFRFKKDHWLSRPAWFSERLSEYSAIEEVSKPWEREQTEYVFCEDTSSFHKRPETKEFVIESHSPFSRRFVKHLENVDYTPRDRLIR